MRADLTGIPPEPAGVGEIREILVDDLSECWLALRAADTPVHRRNYVRSVFALFDGFTAVLKAAVLSEYQAGRCCLSPGEISILREKSYHVAKGP